MNGIKRMTIAVRASLDRVLTQVENHEAVTQSALEDLHRHLARARAHSSRVQRDGDALRKEVQRANAAVETWRQRAISTDAHDGALECVRRSRDAQAQAIRLQERLMEHAHVSKRLQKEMRTLEERYAALTAKKRLLEARDAEARALEITEGSVHSVGSDVETLLERWEMTIDERSYQLPGVEEDEFEVSYVEAEERQELEAELAALRGER